MNRHFEGIGALNAWDMGDLEHELGESIGARMSNGGAATVIELALNQAFGGDLDEVSGSKSRQERVAPSRDEALRYLEFE